MLYREKLDGAPPRRPRTFFHEHLPTDGMYVVTLHPGTGRATGHLFATAHNVNGAFYGMEEFLRHVQPGRLVVFCTVVREPGWRLGYTAKQEDRGRDAESESESESESVGVVVSAGVGVGVGVDKIIPTPTPADRHWCH